MYMSYSKMNCTSINITESTPFTINFTSTHVYSKNITFEELTEDEYYELNKTFDIVWGVMSFLVTPFVIFGNLFVIISLFKFKRLQTTTNLFIGSLGFSDLFLGLFTLPMYGWFYIHDEIVSYKFLCLMKYSSVIFSLSSSLVNLAVIAVDRYIAILYPLKYPMLMTKNKAKLIISGVWIYHGIIGSLPSLGLNNYDKYNGTVCDFFVVLPMPYTIATTPSTILVGLFLSAFLYYRIYKVAKDHSKKMKNRRALYSNNQFRKDARSAKVMGIILFFFFIFWVPFMLAAPLKYLKISENLVNIIKNFTLTLAMFNSAINPFIYCWLRQDFRCAFYDLIGKHFCVNMSIDRWGSRSSQSQKSSQSRQSKRTIVEGQMSNPVDLTVINERKIPAYNHGFEF